MSLKHTLYNLIKEKGYLSYSEVCQLIVEEEYKLDTATRELRRLTSPKDSKIEPVTKIGKRGQEYISAYKWVEPEPIPQPVAREQVRLL